MRVLVKKSGRTTHGNKQLKAVITEAAWAAARTRNTFYSARYHRLAARRGKKRALIAVGHSILKSVWHVLKESCEYRELGAEYLTQRIEQKRKNYLKKELEALGYKVKISRDAPIP
jgi:hypothetical protein